MKIQMHRKALTLEEGIELWIVNCRRRGLTKTRLNIITSVVSGRKIFTEEVNSIISAGQSPIHGVLDSWEILDDYVALKTVDRSVFLPRGTGILADIRRFLR